MSRVFVVTLHEPARYGSALTALKQTNPFNSRFGFFPKEPDSMWGGKSADGGRYAGLYGLRPALVHSLMRQFETLYRGGLKGVISSGGAHPLRSFLGGNYLLATKVAAE